VSLTGSDYQPRARRTRKAGSDPAAGVGPSSARDAALGDAVGGAWGNGPIGPAPAVPAELRYSSAAGRWVVLATVLGSGMAGIDATVVGIALPTIGRQFHSSVDDLQWVTNAYMLTLSGLLLIGGALGDRFGRRKLFQIGTAWFALASLVCGLAPNAPALIGARALQGAGAALLTPGSLAILQASFVQTDRSRAIGAWSGLSGVAMAAGPLLGGWLISAVSWRLIFLINLPVAVAVLAVSARHVPESANPSAKGRVDVGGAVVFCAALAGLTYGLTEGAAFGWGSWVTVAALGLGVLLLATFVLVERARAGALLPLDLFRSQQFSGANLVTFAVYGALGGALFLVPIDLQQVLRYTPLAAGMSLLPVTFLMLLLSPRSGALAARLGPRLQMSMGPVFVGAGLALLVRVAGGGDYIRDVLPAVLVLGFGLAVTVAPLTAAVLAAAPQQHSGVASAVNNDVARAAALIAVAVLPSAAGLAGRSYLHPVVFSSGFHRAVVIAAGACWLGSVLAVFTISNAGRLQTRPGRPQEWKCGLDAPSAVSIPSSARGGR